MVVSPTPTQRWSQLDLDRDSRTFGRWHGERRGRIQKRSSSRWLSNQRPTASRWMCLSGLLGAWLAHPGWGHTGCRPVVAVKLWLGPRKTVIGTAWGRPVEGLEKTAGGRCTEEKTDEKGVGQSCWV